MIALVNFAQPLPTDTRTTRRRTLGVVFLYFLIAGAATVMLGPALPLLKQRWGLPDSELGTLFAVYFAGQLCGSWVAARRVGLSLLLGAAGPALGCAVLAVSGVVAGHFALLLIGLGVGAGLTAGNVIAGTILAEDGETSPRLDGRGTSRSRLLALLNVCWGVGAIACPLLLDASVLVHRSTPDRGQLFFGGLAIAFAGCAALTAWVLPRSLYRAMRSEQARTGVQWQVVWLFVVTLMLYVGVENSLGGWLPTYAERSVAGGTLDERASSLALCFWISELAGRGVMALVIQKVNERLYYRGSLLVLIPAIGVLVFSPHMALPWIFVFTAVMAVSLSPLFPLAVSFLLGRTGNHPQVGKVFASASLGGTVLPWLTGALSMHFHDLRIGFAVPAVGAMAMLALSVYLPRGSRG